jgi:hypothetical protein
MRTQHSLLASTFLTRDNPVTLERRDNVAIRPNSFNDRDNTIEAVIATPTPVQRQDARGAFSEVLDTAGADLAALRGGSVLDAHQQGGVGSILGTVADAWREGNQIIARLQLSTRPELAAIVQDIRAGIINAVSVGYSVEQWQDGTDASGKRTRTAVKWTPREVSMVPVAADRNARTRGAPTDRTEANRAIRDLCQRAGVASTVTDGLIDRSATVEEARNMIFDDLLTRGALPIRTGGHNDNSNDNPEAFQRAAGEALFTRVTPSHVPSYIARQYIGLTIPDIARVVLQRAGVNVMAMSAVTLIERALHTSSDFALILADTVGRTLRQTYTVPASGIRTLARETTAADFRTKHRLMLDSSGLTLDKVNEHGEFKSGTMAEAEETYALDSFGRIFGISRKAMINDDLGAFTDIARRLGQAATAFEAQFLVNLLISNSGLGPVMSDTKKLFHTDHGNISGAGAVPSETTLSAARLAMRKQTGPSGGLISVTPRYLVAPPDMETACEKLLTTIQAIKTDDVNVFARLALVIEPRLTDTQRWYLAADPAEIDGLEYAYLAGAPGPQIETKVGFEVDGIQLKCRIDFGGGFVDWRGWQTNAGH